jgi:S-adenosylmethionine/arginine decarboxylase-like enzyme
MDDTLGKHVIIELSVNDGHILNDNEKLINIFRRAINVCGAHIVSEHFHQFTPQGYSGIIELGESPPKNFLEGSVLVSDETSARRARVSGNYILSESHMSFHTWPEKGYSSLDFYTCGSCNPELCIPVLKDAFDDCKLCVIYIERGKLTYDKVDITLLKNLLKSFFKKQKNLSLKKSFSRKDRYFSIVRYNKDYF